MNRAVFVLLSSIMVLMNPVIVPAQEEEKLPAWVLYEQGKMALENNEAGEAANLFIQAIEKAVIFPEAEVALGDVYAFEKEFLLAEQQYLKTLENPQAFIVSEMEYQVRYKLARLHEEQEHYGSMEEHLLKVLEDQPYYSHPKHDQFRKSFYNIYVERGLDQLFRLYRMEGVQFALKAHVDLGWLYYRTGRYNGSIRNSLYALDIMVTEAVSELRKLDPEYEYIELGPFLDSALVRENIEDYFFRENFFRILYYLASANYAAGHPSRAFDLWRFLADYEPAGRYSSLSKRQLASPWIEPPLKSKP